MLITPIGPCRAVGDGKEAGEGDSFAQTQPIRLMLCRVYHLRDLWLTPVTECTDPTGDVCVHLCGLWLAFSSSRPFDKLRTNSLRQAQAKRRAR